MAVERTPGGTSLIDVLDRVLDKGIVIDAWVRISLVGIDLITIEARVVVASIDTYLKYAEAVGLTPVVSRPTLTPGVEGVETETRRRVTTVEVEKKCNPLPIANCRLPIYTRAMSIWTKIGNRQS
jgi:gas vesicle structural protein